MLWYYAKLMSNTTEHSVWHSRFDMIMILKFGVETPVWLFLYGKYFLNI